MKRKRVVLLGATGSIGDSTLKVANDIPERMEIVGLAANSNANKLAVAANKTRAPAVCIVDERKIDVLRSKLEYEPKIFVGESGLCEIAKLDGADMVLIAIVGTAGLHPALDAIETGKDLAVASKEILVMAGEAVTSAAQRRGVKILPVDSEHNAIFQALSAGRREDIRRIVLTASGGPFRTWPLDAIRKVTVEQALKHPTWSMGPKVTIDSATLMNKGLELIEAHHLFALRPDELDVLVHPQSIVHGLVEFRDGSVIAQLGSPDMRIPIAHCLAWPVRMGTPAPRLDLARVASLSFEEPDLTRFPALGIARRALAAGGSAPTVLNAANEVAVREFVAGRLGFCGIAGLVEATLDAAQRRGETAEPQSVEEALAIDHNARRLAADLLPEIAAMAC